MAVIGKVTNKQLIDSNALNERFDKRIKWLRLDMHDQYSLGLYHGAITDKDLINEMPIIASDVAPVRRGRWEDKSGLYSCSECGMTCPYDVQADVIEYWPCSYCPNCGAKMSDDGERKEGAD